MLSQTLVGGWEYRADSTEQEAGAGSEVLSLAGSVNHPWFVDTSTGEWRVTLSARNAVRVRD